MKRYLLGTLFTFVGLFSLVATVQAQSADVVVHIKQDFVAGGKSLPAGTYRIYQALPATGQVLMLRGDEPGATAFLLSTVHDTASAGALQVKLTLVGDTYYLSEVTTNSEVYTLPLPHAAPNTARTKGRSRMASSGSR